MRSNLFRFTSIFSLFELFAPWKTIQTFRLTLKEKNISENNKENGVREKMEAKKTYHENSPASLSKKRKSYAENSRSDWVNKF